MPLFEPERPHRLGQYRVLSELGRGGAGIVYRAVGPDGAAVAIKTLGRFSEVGLASLRSEIHALRRVDHPGVVRVFDDGIEAGRPWFAMELLEGETLADYARRMPRAMPPAVRPDWTEPALARVLRLIAGICVPLAALHDNGIVHRDLKPENVFLRDERTPVLMDFGLARQLAPRDARASAYAPPIAGTLAYMAPEQRTGAVIDARTDLYALGCILFELLVGAPPPRPSSSAAGPVPRPSQRVGGIPPSLDALVASLLRPRPRDRIGHAEDVGAWVASLLDPTSPRPDPVARRGQWLYRPFLSGRSEAIAALSAGLGRARRGRGSFYVVEGESGIGKTHVVYEIARRATDDCAIIPIASEPAGTSREGPLASWTRFFEGVIDRSIVDAQSYVSQLVVRHLPLLRGIHSGFARLDPSVGPPHQLPSRDEVAALLRDLVAAFCEEGPVLLLFDDLQWADELTLGVLGLMTESWLEGRPVLVLATCRSDEGPPGLASILGLPGVERVRLGPLGDASLRDLVADMLGVAEPPDGVVAFIARRADGNPFVAAEYLRLLVNELPVRREFSLPAIRIAAPSPESLDALHMPGSVRELVARRIEVLDDACRGLAELIAVLGGSVDATVYASLCEDVASRDALLELDRRQLTEATDDGGRRLPHDRVRVVVYDMLVPSRRRELHRDAALLLSRHPSRDPSDVPHAALARHFLSAGMFEQALPHLESAGEQALSRAAYGAAAENFENVLATSTLLAQGGASFELARRVRWAHGAARAAFGTGDVEGCEANVRQALALVGRALPRSRAGWPLLAIAEALKTGAEGMTPRLGTGPSRSPVLPEAFDPSILADVAQATSLLPYRYFFEEDLVPLVASALLAANLARAADPAKVLPAPSSMLAAMLGLARLAGPARRFFQRAQSAAVAEGDWREAATAYALESIYEGSFARWDAAERAAQNASRACEHSSDPWLRENVETTLSHVEFFTGRFEDARRRAEFLAHSAIGRQNIQHEIWGLFLQARSDIPRAKYDDARVLLEAALARLETRPESISEIACRGMLSHVLWNQGETARAQGLANHVNRLVKTKLPPAYPSLVGYAAAAHVHRAALEASPSRDRWRAATELAVGLWRFAAVFPVAVPAAHLHTAHLLRLAGWRGASHALFVRGASRAKRWGMPREHGLLLLGAAQTDAAPAGQSRSLPEARRILDSIRCSSQMF